MILPLEQLVEIKPGIYRTTSPGGTVHNLMPSDFDSRSQFIGWNKPMISNSDIDEKHLLRANDILLATKSVTLTAIAFDPAWGKSIASSSLAVLRPRFGPGIPKIDIHYLTWYLNSEQARKKLKGMTVGTAVLSIPATSLRALEIEVPSIKVQHEILIIHELFKKKVALSEELIALEKQLMQRQLESIIQNSSN